MPDFPIVKNVDPVVLSPLNPQSLGAMLNAMGYAFTGATAWATANKAIFIPYSVGGIVTVKKMFVVNGTVSGNIDVGIYDRNGVRLVSIGSTAQAGASVIQEFDIADTTLGPGLYYLACAMDNNTGQVELVGPGSAQGKSMGIFEMTSAFALPATATFASLSGTVRVPFIGAHLRTVI